MTDLPQISNADDERLQSEQLLPLLYQELRQRASQLLAGELPGQTLQSTALVHEAFLRIAGDEGQAAWNSRGHFFVAAATAMRRILVDRARARDSLKRGGELQRVPLPEIPAAENDEGLLALDEALTRLAEGDTIAARVVELHHFAGMSHEEVAAALELSVYQVRQKWAFARAWLKTALQEL